MYCGSFYIDFDMVFLRFLYGKGIFLLVTPPDPVRPELCHGKQLIERTDRIFARWQPIAGDVIFLKLLFFFLAEILIGRLENRDRMLQERNAFRPGFPIDRPDSAAFFFCDRENARHVIPARVIICDIHPQFGRTADGVCAALHGVRRVGVKRLAAYGVGQINIVAQESFSFSIHISMIAPQFGQYLDLIF